MSGSEEAGTVHMGFIIGFFGDSDIAECISGDKELFEKWTKLKTMLRGSHSVAEKVDQETNDLFYEIFDHVQERYSIDMPRHPSELR